MKLARLALTALVAVSTTSQAFAFEKAGMDSCTALNSPLRSSDRAIIISKSSNSGTVDLFSREEGRTQKLGSLGVAQVQLLNPALRQAASAGLTVAYVGGAIVSAGFLGFAGMMSFWGATAAEATSGVVGVSVIGGIETAAGASLQFVDGANPVAQFERANVERCLTEQVASLTHNGQAIVIRMASADDLSDTKGALLDVIHDLNQH